MDKDKKFIEVTFYGNNNKALVSTEDILAITEHLESNAAEEFRNKIKIFDPLGMSPLNGNVFQESYEEIRAALVLAGMVIEVPLINRKID